MRNEERVGARTGGARGCSQHEVHEYNIHLKFVKESFARNGWNEHHHHHQQQPTTNNNDTNKQKQYYLSSLASRLMID